jgi:hypothetical protein
MYSALKGKIEIKNNIGNNIKNKISCILYFYANITKSVLILICIIFAKNCNR